MPQPSVRLPAEWENQDGVLLSWPTATSDWQPHLSQIIPVFIELVRQISRFEQVIIVTPTPDETITTLQQATVALNRVQCYAIDNNDTWSRDFGPISVLRNGIATLYDFGFNGWGLKFAADKDNQINRRLAAQHAFKVPLLTQPLILEGGSIESDGAGTLLTTSECMLSANRNPHLEKQQLETFFAEQLGIRHTLWLDHGYLAGDDTDSHIDTLARLCPNNTILYVSCNDEQDEHYAALKQMEEQLHSFRSIDDQPYRLLPLPWPQPQFDDNGDGERLPATYANFLVINNAVLVPIYDDPADTEALQLIGDAFTDREIIAINCNAVIQQHGSLHCLTMQLHQGTLS
ncbi:MAG: agmatine deiminase family protein [Desulfuromonas sp.]|nr:agmatine deiminase family protein [Desulfuromonas sp.]